MANEIKGHFFCHEVTLPFLRRTHASHRHRRQTFIISNNNTMVGTTKRYNKENHQKVYIHTLIVRNGRSVVNSYRRKNDGVLPCPFCRRHMVRTLFSSSSFPWRIESSVMLRSQNSKSMWGSVDRFQEICCSSIPHVLCDAVYGRRSLGTFEYYDSWLFATYRSTWGGRHGKVFWTVYKQVYDREIPQVSYDFHKKFTVACGNTRTIHDTGTIHGTGTIYSCITPNTAHAVKHGWKWGYFLAQGELERETLFFTQPYRRSSWSIALCCGSNSRIPRTQETQGTEATSYDLGD